MKTPIAIKTDGADLKRSQTLSETTGSLYIHVPFCTKKCPYCHFFVLPYQKENVASYLKALKAEWEMRNPFTKLRSIYFGGGTPSLLEPDQVAFILDFINLPAEEITLEANPETVTYELMKGYQEIGINRISIGVQSLDETSLIQIGRSHSALKAVSAVEMTYKAGIENISIDLMYDLPSQTLSSWKKSIDLASRLPISHLSLYNLTFEPGSSYFKHQKKLIPSLPSEETSLEMLEYAIATLERNNLKRYEISAFCKEGAISIHNTGYWTARPFIGIGPSAFSYQEGRRFQNIPHLKKWEQAVLNGREATDFEEKLPYPQNIHELLAVRLRLLEGAPLSEFPNLPIETDKILLQLELEGYLQKTTTQILLTEKGRRFYDTVASEIV